ncbi:hypothetical protein [Pseudomonas typographi]|uniref:Uncharacterized protein n=1 Tax=Pseudomonas typographi TaxID=2715964 RepID=A0ABR7YZM9_9PSED|nr:hypothetical protein [Pseudomonas typographi]MBD1586748.1 hypothetical protein [Pseudomonas typographi]MBD1598642.1 hypothetical protein [Pseudomonas typographi]
MNINIAHIGNNDWFDFKADILYGLYHTLTALGHHVSMSHNQFFSGYHNLVVGADWLVEEAHLQHIKTTHIEYSIFDVESFDGKTINQRAGFKIDNYLELLNRSTMIITPYKYNFRAYANCGLAEKAVYAPWGYFEQLVDPNINRQAATHFDAVFFGLVKGVRKQKIDQLADIAGMRLKTVSTQDPHLSRAYYLSASRFGLSLGAGPEEQFVNPFRIYLMTANGIPVLADNANDEDGYLKYTARGSLDDIHAFFSDPHAEFTLSGALADGHRLTASFASVF